MKKQKYLFLLAAMILSGGMGAQHAHAQTATSSLMFSYDEVGQVLSISASDGQPFNSIIGVDQYNSGLHFFNGTSTYNTQAGFFGDAVGSEWLISNDETARYDPPCTIPDYTGDPATDFQACTDAITSDGGTYELGIFGVVPPPVGGGTDPEVFIGNNQASTTMSMSAMAVAASDPDTQAAVAAGTGGVGKITNDGFLVKKGATMTVNQTSGVSRIDGRLLNTMVANGIVKKNGNLYTFKKNYTFASPSQPAALILNKLVDGWAKWKTSAGKSLAKVYNHT